MSTIKLPVSGYEVEIRDTITYGEYEELANFIQNRMQIEVIGNEQKAVMNGTLLQEMQEKIVQTFLHSCRIPGGEEKSTIGLLKTLDVDDGMFLKDEIGKIYEDIKKKHSSKEKE